MPFSTLGVSKILRLVQLWRYVCLIQSTFPLYLCTKCSCSCALSSHPHLQSMLLHISCIFCTGLVIGLNQSLNTPCLELLALLIAPSYNLRNKILACGMKLLELVLFSMCCIQRNGEAVSGLIGYSEYKQDRPCSEVSRYTIGDIQEIFFCILIFLRSPVSFITILIVLGVQQSAVGFNCALET